MSNEKKYSNIVRTISNELADVASSTNQQKAVEKKAKEYSGKALTGAVGLSLKALGQEEAVNKAKQKIESFIESKVPYAKYASLSNNTIGIKYGNETFNSAFTMNKDGSANVKLNKAFKNNLSTELEADKKNIKLGLKLNF